MNASDLVKWAKGYGLRLPDVAHYLGIKYNTLYVSAKRGSELSGEVSERALALMSSPPPLEEGSHPSLEGLINGVSKVRHRGRPGPRLVDPPSLEELELQEGERAALLHGWPQTAITSHGRLFTGWRGQWIERKPRENGVFSVYSPDRRITMRRMDLEVARHFLNLSALEEVTGTKLTVRRTDPESGRAEDLEVIPFKGGSKLKGERARELREQASSLSQRELAVTYGVTEAAVSQLLKGVTHRWDGDRMFYTISVPVELLASLDEVRGDESPEEALARIVEYALSKK